MRIEWHPQGFLNELRATLAVKLEESAIVVEGKAKDNCPVKTGKLRNSIRYMDLDKTELRAIIGSDVEYAPYVELGHKIKGSSKTVPPKPFLRTGLMQSINRIIQIFSHK